MLYVVAAGFLAMPGAPVVLSGDTTCPAAADVAAELAPLMPPGDRRARPDGATLASRRTAGLPDGVVVRLERPDGSVIGKRHLAPSASCSELARSAAALVAAWETELHPEVSLPVDKPPMVGARTDAARA